MWAAFGNPATVPPMAFAIAAIFAKSSTLYNPIVYLVFKPNFRKLLCRDLARCRRTLGRCLCRSHSAQKTSCKQECNSINFSDFTDYNQQQTARVLKGSLHQEVAVSQLSNELQSDFLWTKADHRGRHLRNVGKGKMKEEAEAKSWRFWRKINFWCLKMTWCRSSTYSKQNQHNHKCFWPGYKDEKDLATMKTWNECKPWVTRPDWWQPVKTRCVVIYITVCVFI